MRIGYACINMQLSYPQKWGGQERGVKPITTGRSMIRRTFDTKGLDYASEVTLNNVRDLDKIISFLWSLGSALLKIEGRETLPFLSILFLNEDTNKFMIFMGYHGIIWASMG